MEMHDLIAPDRVIANLKATSKKQALQEKAVFEVLLERERLGSTGVGYGVAIPHGKLPGLKRLYGFFARLASPIDFEAVDDQPVDLVFLLLAPETAGADHLKALARISRLLRDRETCEKLRGSDSGDAIYALLTEVTARSAA
jgi:PTS system nitrogen regulatory IIA component